MKAFIKYIAVIDHDKMTHYVELSPGPNLITGRSSTGKSALLEIFDYCFGSSENTIPEGIITDNAQLYYVVIVANSTNLVLARKTKNKAFLKIDSGLSSIDNLTMEYFSEDYFLPLSDFKRSLGNFWGITIDDTDEDLEDRKFRNNEAKKGRPSVRNFTSYIFQNQNLIANKHSLFYRFDEKEKREQTIDQFKIFMGFVDQEYYILQQNLNQKKKELDALRREQLEQESERQLLRIKVDSLLEDYYVITGTDLISDSSGSIFANPKYYLDKISMIEISPENNSEVYLIRLKDLQKQKNEIIANKRDLSIRLNDINTSIEYAKSYAKSLDRVEPIKAARLYSSECPFCHKSHENIKNEANNLFSAIEWLNLELGKTPLLLDSFLPEKQKCQIDIEAVNKQLLNVQSCINKVLSINEQLRKNRSLEVQGFKVKLQIEAILEQILDYNQSDLLEQIDSIKRQVDSLQSQIDNKYKVDKKMVVAEKIIIKQMNDIGAMFDFEKTYKPVNLNFSLKDFELWYQRKSDKKKIYLRSMGSGANWLYCHISLFLSLQKYFCSLKEKCLLPSILFLDQPSQVYFPVVIDTGEQFNPKKLKKKQNKSKDLDPDIKSVTNLYDQFVIFCKKTYDETGIEPQIIITDHVDSLNLTNPYSNFESLVKYRWRGKKDGFIKLSGKNKRKKVDNKNETLLLDFNNDINLR